MLSSNQLSQVVRWQFAGTGREPKFTFKCFDSFNMSYSELRSAPPCGEDTAWVEK